MGSIIKNKRIIEINQNIEYEPNNNGIVINNPPQAFLENVRNDATDKDTMNKIEEPFLKTFFVFSKNIAIEKGHTIFNQHPA